MGRYLAVVTTSMPRADLPLLVAGEIVGHMTYFARQGLLDSPSGLTAGDRWTNGRGLTIDADLRRNDGYRS
jgi:hypothetical protein